MSKLIPLPASIPGVIDEYLPVETNNELPFITLTYATSLDSRISAAPGVQTVISHLETKTMTHYLRYHHDAILIGVGTALADNPGLNCRWTPDNVENNDYSNAEEEKKLHLILPIIVDPHFKWDPRGSRLLENVKNKTGLAPYVIVREDALNDNTTGEISAKIKALEELDGKVIKMSKSSYENGTMKWREIFSELYKEKTPSGKPIRSIMVEGGAKVINNLLDEASSLLAQDETSPPLISSVIVTVGPVFLGSQGVCVSPITSQPRLNKVRWWTGTRDAVVCGRL